MLPGPLLVGTVGDTLRVRFINGLSEKTSIHWHGLPVPLGVDGVIGISRPAVAPGQEFTYELPLTHAGTYWYHPHVEDHLTSALYGAIIVRPANPAEDPPFDLEEVILLHDSTTAAGGGLLAPAPNFAPTLLNGRPSAGQTPIVVRPGHRLRLRIVNAAARETYVVALDGHILSVTHADGQRVVPVSVAAIPIGPGERYDAIVDLNNPGIWSLAVAAITARSTTLVRGIVQYAGQIGASPAPGCVPPALATGALLSYSQLAAAAPAVPAGSPNRIYPLALQMAMGPGGVAWTFNEQVWPNVTPMVTAPGEIVQLDLTNTGMMGGSQYHPIHVHGHFFRVLGTQGGLAAPPVKDTILIRPTGQAWSAASVQLSSQNPGRWMVHCHDAMHMMMGMMTLLDYLGDSDLDGIADALDMDPLSPHPVLALPDQALAYLPGGSGTIGVQGTPGQSAHLFAGLPLSQPIELGAMGRIWLQGPILIDSATIGAGATAGLPYALPMNPTLSGVRLGLQAVISTPGAPGLRLSAMQAFLVL
jgi:FtsP/CotA-like multicopper oxidase with cupredoxin domain